jgi:hypothetical protein
MHDGNEGKAKQVKMLRGEYLTDGSVSMIHLLAADLSLTV